MGNTAVALAGLAVAGVAVAALAFYRWQERRRVRRVNRWVGAFLVGRYGTLPTRLSVNCFEDFLCPVVVRFDHPVSGARHRLLFSCRGSAATFSLLAEKEERR